MNETTIQAEPAATPVAEAIPAQATEAVAATAATVEVPAQETPGAQPAPQQQSGFSMLMPMLIILAIFYFMMIRPQQRKEKERRKMIDELTTGKKVVFASGLVGEIVEANEKTFKIETSPGTVLEVVRSAVQGLAE